MTQPIFIILHCYEYTQGLCYFPFEINLDRRTGSCNTVNDLSNKVCVPNKRKGLNLNVSNMITGINKSQT